MATTTKDDDDDDDDTDNNDDGKRKKNSRDFKRLWALEQTCSIMSALSPSDRSDVLRFCLFHAFYSTSKKQVPKSIIGKNIEDCPDTLRRAFSTRLLGMLLTNIRSRGRRSSRNNTLKILRTERNRKVTTTMRKKKRSKSLTRFQKRAMRC